ncbi:MAG: hypothetical protein IJ764_05355 [Bacteroidales bacterium]|nr:hypothetical protein [Bacteroidales bacterium]
MKKIVVLLLVMAAFGGLTYAQRSSVAEKDVPSRMVIDFQRQQLDCRNISWYKLDSASYEVEFIDGDDARQSIRYTPRGTETRYFVDIRYCPGSIKDTIKHRFPKFKLTELSVRSTRRTSAYEARIARTTGILFWKKEREARFLNFDTSGKYLDED